DKCVFVNVDVKRMSFPIWRSVITVLLEPIKKAIPVTPVGSVIRENAPEILAFGRDPVDANGNPPICAAPVAVPLLVKIISISQNTTLPIRVYRAYRSS